MLNENEAVVRASWRKIQGELGRCVLGQDELLEQLWILILTRGHGVVVGLPGVAKFLAASSLARVAGLVFHRIRCTPDLSPEDLVIGCDGREGTGHDDASCGLLSANVLLVDDMDRLSPKTSSTVHHAIQDREVVLRGQRLALPNPFVVLATRYPLDETAETPYEPRNDRFMFEVRVRYPDYGSEYRMIETSALVEERPVQQLFSPAELLALQLQIPKIELPPYVIHYAVRLIRSTRVHEGENPDFVYEWVVQGAGPRALRHLMIAAQARAAMRGASSAAICDVRSVALPVLRHRIITNRNARSNGITPDRVVNRLLEDIPERLAGDDQPVADGEVADPQQWFPDGLL